MRRVAAVLPFLLAACDAPMEEAFPPQSLNIARDGITFSVRTQYDPLGGGWFTRVWSFDRPLGQLDRALVTQVVTEDLGSTLCDGGRMEVGEGDLWNPFAGERMMLFESRGEWRLVATCV